MCDDKKKCCKSEKNEKRPEDCTPGKIKECHGDSKKHPCCDKKKK